MATTTSLFRDHIERYAWEHAARGWLPGNAGYFWGKLREFAESQLVREHGHPIYAQGVWQNRIDARAEEIMTELGVEHEIYAGNRYVAGKRVYWSNGRYTQDDYR